MIFLYFAGFKIRFQADQGFYDEWFGLFSRSKKLIFLKCLNFNWIYALPHLNAFKTSLAVD